MQVLGIVLGSEKCRSVRFVGVISLVLLGSGRLVRLSVCL